MAALAGVDWRWWEAIEQGNENVGNGIEVT